MGSRNRDGERMHTNLLPYDGSLLKDRPNVASGEDVVVRAITLGTNGFPSYMHPGGVQAVGDLLVIGTEDPINNPGASDATVLFTSTIRRTPSSSASSTSRTPATMPDPTPWG